MFFNDLYQLQLDTVTWIKLDFLSPPGARSRIGFTSALDGTIYLFGGIDGTCTKRSLNDMYNLNPSTKSWFKIEVNGLIPSARAAMGFTSAPNGNIYLLGGADMQCSNAGGNSISGPGILYEPHVKSSLSFKQNEIQFTIFFYILHFKMIR